MPFLDPEHPIKPSRLLVPDTALEPDLAGVDLGDHEPLQAGQVLSWPAEATVPERTVRLRGDARPLTFKRDLAYRLGRSPEGRDVLAVSRTLHMHGFRMPDPTMIYGWRMRDNVRLFQRHQNMRQTGVYDGDTHRHLSPLFDAYGRWLYSHQDVQPPAPAWSEKIDRLMHNLWLCYSLRPWAYRQLRPFMLYPSGHRITYTYDCSWFFKQVYYMSGLMSPDADGYVGGYGNTETLRSHGDPVSPASIQPGDGIFYGRYGSSVDPAHVTMASGHGMCIGFGGVGGPRLLPEDYRSITAVRRYVRR